MSKFNEKKEATKTINKAGGVAYKQDAKTALVSTLLTSFVNGSAYTSGSDEMNQLIEQMEKVDPEFCAKAIVYARNEFGMRSITHVGAAHLASRASGTEWGKRFYESVVRQPDDVTETLAYYLKNISKKLPNSMKKGFGSALSGMSDYAISKYKGGGNTVSMVDAVNLLHPKATDTLTALMTGKLEAPDTWEVGLTQAGSDAEKKKAVWMNLLSENKLGYFALLRNIRNIVIQAPEGTDMLCEQLVDEKSIKKSLVMPFRFMKAYEVLMGLSSNESKVRSALNKAIEISLNNVPTFEGKTLVVVDESYSMQGQPIEIASLFASAILKKNPDCDYMQFAVGARHINMNTDDSLASMTEVIRKSVNGGGTDFHKIFPAATKAYDRVIILSDMQGWIGYHSPQATFSAYCKKYSCKSMIYSFDLTGHSTSQFPAQNIACVAGFSDKV